MIYSEQNNFFKNNLDRKLPIKCSPVDVEILVSGLTPNRITNENQ